MRIPFELDPAQVEISAIRAQGAGDLRHQDAKAGRAAMDEHPLACLQGTLGQQRHDAGGRCFGQGGGSGEIYPRGQGKHLSRRRGGIVGIAAPGQQGADGLMKAEAAHPGTQGSDVARDFKPGQR